MSEKIKNCRRNIKPKNKYKLWIENNGECNFCSKELLSINSNKDNSKLMSNLGEFAHIVSFGQKNGVRNRKNKCNVIDQRFANCETNLDHKEYWDSKKKIYIDSAVNCYCNLILLCHDCHKNFDRCEFNERINDENINKTIINSISNDMSDEYFTQIYDFIGRNISNKKTRKTNFIKPLITIYRKNNNNEIEYDNVDEILEIVKDYSKEAIIVIFPYTDDLYEFKQIYSNFFKVYNLCEVKKIKNWDTFAKNVRLFNKNNFVLKFSFSNENNSCWYVNFQKKDFYNLDNEIKGHKKLIANISSVSKSKEYLLKNIYNQNSPNPNVFFVDKPEFEIISNILMKELKSFAESEIKEFNSFSIAYFARWGTGKTSMIRTIVNELNQFYNCIEINLWNISNLVSNKLNYNNDSFVRNIVKEAITQLIKNDNYVRMYVDSNKRLSHTDDILDLKNELLNSLVGLDNKKTTNVTIERSKFIDEFILNIQSVVSTIFELTLKPTIFVFDDIDRINDSDKIVKILDSIVTFLNLKNCVFIFPVDESKIIKAIYETKTNCDPLQYINKYFNYSVNSSSVPKLEIIPTLIEHIEKIETFTFGKKANKINEELIKIVSDFIEPSFRSIKDFSNSFSFIAYSIFKNIEYSLEIKDFSKSIFKKNKDKYSDIVDDYNEYIYLLSLVSVLIHLNFPLIIDFISENIENLRLLIDVLKKELIDLSVDNNYDINFLKEYKNYNVDLDLWEKLIYSITMNKEWYLFIHNKNDIKNELENTEKNNMHALVIQIKSKIKNIQSIFEKFGILRMNDDEIIMLWLSLTLSRIKNKIFIEYMKVSMVSKSLENINLLVEFSSKENWEQKIIDFFFYIDIFYKHNFIKDNEKEKVILELFDSEILYFLKERMSTENFKKLVNIEKLSILLCNIIFHNNKKSIEEKYISLLINCYSTFKISSSIQKDISITMKQFQTIINSLNNSKIENFINNNIEIININNEIIHCNTIVSSKTFNYINCLTKNNIEYTSMPEPISNYNEFIKDINLIRSESIDWMKIIENKKIINEGINNLIKLLNHNNLECLIHFIENEFNTVKKILTPEEIHKILELKINNFSYKSINSLLNILWLTYKEKNALNSELIIKFISNNSSTLHKYKSSKEQMWYYFLDKISKTQDKNIIVNIIDFFKKNSDFNKINDYKFSLMYELLEKSLLLLNDNNFIYKNINNMVFVDEKVNKNGLREICLIKTNKFNEELAYKGMRYYQGANIDDIIEHDMIWNDDNQSIVEIQSKIIIDYILKNKSCFWIEYNKHKNNNFIYFIEGSNKYLCDNHNNIFDPLYIFSKNNDSLNEYCENHYSKCKVSTFRKLKNVDIMNDFNIWYKSKINLLKDIDENYEEIFLEKLNDECSIKEFIDIGNNCIKEYYIKKDNIEKWFDINKIEIKNNKELKSASEKKERKIKKARSFLNNDNIQFDKESSIENIKNKIY